MTALSRSLSLLLCGVVIALTCACAKTPDLPLQISDLRMGVAPFTQPTLTEHLMAGYIPENQGLASAQDLADLNEDLLAKLAVTGRQYPVIPLAQFPPKLAQDSQGRRSALSAWVELAVRYDVELLIVPVVLDWRERLGGTSGVITPAAVTVDFFLIDARGAGSLLKRSHYALEQQSLADNLLTLHEFLQRKGRWISAEELACEGIDKAIREFGL